MKKIFDTSFRAERSVVEKSPAIKKSTHLTEISPFRSITLRFSRNDREKLRESDFKPGGIILWVFFDIFDDIFDGFVFV